MGWAWVCFEFFKSVLCIFIYRMKHVNFEEWKGFSDFTLCLKVK